jgi:hypothetical protein
MSSSPEDQGCHADQAVNAGWETRYRVSIDGNVPCRVTAKAEDGEAGTWHNGADPEVFRLLQREVSERLARVLVRSPNGVRIRCMCNIKIDGWIQCKAGSRERDRHGRIIRAGRRELLRSPEASTCAVPRQKFIERFARLAGPKKGTVGISD